VEPADFAKEVARGAEVLDVRRMTEIENGHVKDATAIPLADLSKNMESVEKDETVYIHCAGGYRSVVASSMLKAQGYDNIVNVHCGWNKIKLTDVPVVTGAPSNMTLS
jgi:rhodanese-related sulfurtransferase